MAYNVKVFEYDDFYQFRFYDCPIIEKQDRHFDRDDLSDINEVNVADRDDEGINLREKETGEIEVDRTEQAIQHSRIVSLNRSVQKIYEIAFSNKWDYFITLTFDPKKVDSLDYDVVIKKTTQWLNNMSKRRTDGNLKYLFIPEKHKSGAYHIHGLLADCGTMEFVDSGRVSIGNKCFKRTENNAHYPTIYNIGNWRYGFSTASEVQDSDRVCSYLTKYVTKDLVIDLKGRRRYFPSNNLNRPEVQTTLFSQDEMNNYIAGLLIDGKVGYMKEQDIQNTNQRIRYITVRK